MGILQEQLGSPVEEVDNLVAQVWALDTLQEGTLVVRQVGIQLEDKVPAEGILG